MSENNSMERFLSLLPELRSSSMNSTRVKVILASRPERHIKDSLERHALEISANSNIVKGDIDTYVREGGLVKLKKNLGLDGPEELEFRKELVNRSEGMFLWVCLAIKEAERTRGLTTRGLGSLVSSLPSGLSALYDLMLKKIDIECRGKNNLRLLFRDSSIG
jgi:hypothetical protein